MRPALLPEYPVYAAASVEGGEEVTAGIADAVSFGPDGKPKVVIDWKTDVQPTAETMAHYRDQVCKYLDVTGAEQGLIVLVTTKEVVAVAPPSKEPARRALGA